MYGFSVVISMTASYLIVFFVHLKFINEFDLNRNKPKVIMNDLNNINFLKETYNTQPQVAGAPVDQVNQQSNQPIL